MLATGSLQGATPATKAKLHRLEPSSYHGLVKRAISEVVSAHFVDDCPQFFSLEKDGNDWKRSGRQPSQSAKSTAGIPNLEVTYGRL